MERHFIERQTNLNFIFCTSNKLEHVHWWTIELQHPIFGLERKDIKPNRHITRFTKLLIEKTPISFFRTSNEFKRDLLLVIKLKQLRTQFAQSLERWKVVIFLVMDRTPSHWTLNGLEHVFIFRNRTWQLYFWMNIVWPVYVSITFRILNAKGFWKFNFQTFTNFNDIIVALEKNPLIVSLFIWIVILQKPSSSLYNSNFFLKCCLIIHNHN